MPLGASSDIESGKVRATHELVGADESRAVRGICPDHGVYWKGRRHPGGPMFDLTFDRNHNVLLARFAGVFSSEDVESLDRTLTAFISRHGFARGIFDFSLVKANAAPQTFLTWHGRLPQILLGQERVIVAPQQWSYELACAYAAQQRDFGNVEPQVVRSLGDACHLLRVERPDFQPVA